MYYSQPIGFLKYPETNKNKTNQFYLYMARNFSALENICPYTNRNGAKYCLYHGFEDSYNYTLHLGYVLFLKIKL